MGNCYNYTPIPPAEASCIIAHLFVELAAGFRLLAAMRDIDRRCLGARGLLTLGLRRSGRTLAARALLLRLALGLLRPCLGELSRLSRLFALSGLLRFGRLLRLGRRLASCSCGTSPSPS